MKLALEIACNTDDELAQALNKAPNRSPYARNMPHRGFCGRVEQPAGTYPRGQSLRRLIGPETPGLRPPDIPPTTAGHFLLIPRSAIPFAADRLSRYLPAGLKKQSSSCPFEKIDIPGGSR
jgi:hypothetical protein